MLEAVEITMQIQPAVILDDFREVPLYTLQKSPTNPRRSFDEGKLLELAQSIRSQGVLVPLIVRELDLDRFEVVAGARRFRAARLAELASVPVRVVQLSDTQVLASIAAKTGRSITHVYQRLWQGELIPELRQRRGISLDSRFSTS